MRQTMKETIINDLIERSDEEEWFDFKSNYVEPRILGEYISALSNISAVFGKKNGYIVLGIDDKTHEIVGTTFKFNVAYKTEPLQNYLARNLSPSINFSFDELQINEKRVVILTVPAAIKVPTEFNNQRFYRIGSSKVNLKNYPEREALLWSVLFKGYPTMTNTLSPIQDLSFEQLFLYYAAKGMQINHATFKHNLHLVTEDGKYNMLACFLADNGNIPVRVSTFAGKEKSDKLISVKEFGNVSLISAIDRIIDYSNSINAIQVKENLETGVREDVFLYNQECFNEAVKNAFIHNLWTHRAAPMITFFRDRVEILSFSGLAPNQTIDGFFAGHSIPVNEELSVIFLSTHLSERTGKGVPLIAKTFGRSAFEITENMVKVIIPYNWKMEYVVNKTTNKLVASFSTTEIKILDFIISNPHMSQIEIGNKLSLGKTTIQNSIVKFKKFNLITRVGSNKNGYWKVNDKQIINKP